MLVYWRSKKETDMKRNWLYLLIASFLLMGNILVAQTTDNRQKEGEEEPAYPTTGPRFVICSPTGATVKSPLYVKIGEDFLPVRISSRFPSERVTPEPDGTVRFYDEKPALPKDGKKGEEKVKLPPPYMVIRIPRDYARVRSICIVIPGDTPAQNQCFYLRESEFPVGGFHVINFSPTPLEIFHSLTNQFPEKGTTIAPYRRKEDNSIARGDANTWSYVDKQSTKAVAVNYALFAPPLIENGPPLPLRTSRFMVQKRHAELVIVVRHPKISYAYNLITLQYAPDSTGRPPQAAAPPQQGAPAPRTAPGRR